MGEESGTVKINFEGEVWDMPDTCSLDVADRGGVTLEEVGAILNLTRERIRQIEVGALVKLKVRCTRCGHPPHDDICEGADDTCECTEHVSLSG